jgi:hypothetical protein
VLPLTVLSLSDYAAPEVQHLGQWTALTRPGLQYQVWPPGLAEQVKRLTALKDLRLLLGDFGQVPAVSQVQPVVDCIVGMTSLRCLVFAAFLSDEQQAQLRGMTQLTKLGLSHPC